MDMIFLILGLLGSFLCLLMFFLLEQGKTDPKGMTFYSVNGAGAFLVLVSAAHSFDWGDMGTISLETIWTLISLMGLWKAWKRKQAAG